MCIRWFHVATIASLMLGCADDGGAAPTSHATDGNETGSPSNPGNAFDTNYPATLPDLGDPLSGASVYWVGHSLMDGADTTHPGAMNIMGLVGRFASSEGHGYSMYAHITPGTPLSLNWYWRQGEHLPEIRERGDQYDVMVITEAVPLDPQIQWNASHFFARRFFCAAKNANPDMRVYVYETWHHLYASWEDGGYPPPHVWDWRAQLAEDYPKWDSIAAAAAGGAEVDTPDEYEWPGPGEDPAGDCTVTGAVGIIPVGQAFGALHDRLESPREGEDWGDLRMGALFLNGYRDWPEDWPVSSEEASSIDPEPVIAGLSRYHPDQLPDDIHLSALGSYFAGLVHYATVYRRSPVGLPEAHGVSPERARMLQELAWEVVLATPRAGVAAP
jgi:hypothetical protein